MPNDKTVQVVGEQAKQGGKDYKPKRHPMSARKRRKLQREQFFSRFATT